MSAMIDYSLVAAEIVAASPLTITVSHLVYAAPLAAMRNACCSIVADDEMVAYDAIDEQLLDESIAVLTAVGLESYITAGFTRGLALLLA